MSTVKVFAASWRVAATTDETMCEIAPVGEIRRSVPVPPCPSSTNSAFALVEAQRSPTGFVLHAMIGGSFVPVESGRASLTIAHSGPWSPDVERPCRSLLGRTVQARLPESVVDGIVDAFESDVRSDLRSGEYAVTAAGYYAADASVMSFRFGARVLFRVLRLVSEGGQLDEAALSECADYYLRTVEIAGGGTGPTSVLG